MQVNKNHQNGKLAQPLRYRLLRPNITASLKLATKGGNTDDKIQKPDNNSPSGR